MCGYSFSSCGSGCGYSARETSCGVQMYSVGCGAPKNYQRYRKFYGCGSSGCGSSGCG